MEYEDKEALASTKEWSRLEAKFFGEIVRKCWTGEITSGVEILSAVRTAVTEMGVVVGDDDVIVDLAIDGLTMQPR